MATLFEVSNRIIFAMKAKFGRRHKRRKRKKELKHIKRKRKKKRFARNVKTLKMLSITRTRTSASCIIRQEESNKS
jgi:hypothetical protein